jgi:hypothetical protein
MDGKKMMMAACPGGTSVPKLNREKKPKLHPDIYSLKRRVQRV